jgi:hypothetical protein
MKHYPKWRFIAKALRIRYLLVSLCVGLITGCPAPPIGLAVSDCSISHLKIQLWQGQNFFGSSMPAPVYSATFYADVKHYSELWRIESTKGKELSKLTYGIVPEGFTGTQATPLHLNQRVFVSVYGIGFNTLDLTVCK